MKKKLATIAAGVAAALPAFAQESSNTYEVPQSVQTAIDNIADAGETLAGAVAPAVGDIVLAFIGIAALLWVGRFLWRKAQGRS